MAGGVLIFLLRCDYCDCQQLILYSSLVCRERFDPIIDEYVFCRSLAMLRVYNELLNSDQNLRIFSRIRANGSSTVSFLSESVVFVMPEAS